MIGIRLVLFWTLSLGTYAGGYASLEEKTPYGNIIRHYGVGEEIEFVFAKPPNSYAAKRLTFKKFYFYKDKLIAKSDHDFYVIDERDRQVKYFTVLADFEQYLEDNSLEPRIWVRWYDKNFDEANFRWLWFFAVVMAPLTLLFGGIYAYNLFAMIRWKRNRKIRLALAGGLSLFLILVFLFQQFPQSI